MKRMKKKKLDGLGKCVGGSDDSGRSDELERAMEMGTGKPGGLERIWKEDWAVYHRPGPWKHFQKGRAGGLGRVACSE